MHPRSQLRISPTRRKLSLYWPFSWANSTMCLSASTLSFSAARNKRGSRRSPLSLAILDRDLDMVRA
ncbi:hypothetical protein BDV26DRAFT_267724 [Aspergillus bertholletiae]|uniref:Uncharacterized protein n=1 Tax=Aspergillus bertholletiae TaxID=1226010 RepID=A0A5N7B0F0_9EURO|nr:hypothetical protein BDV26DRAFT_267724 [Aspergillus bertholletiae]